MLWSLHVTVVTETSLDIEDGLDGNIWLMFETWFTVVGPSTRWWPVLWYRGILPWLNALSLKGTEHLQYIHTNSTTSIYLQCISLYYFRWFKRVQAFTWMNKKLSLAFFFFLRRLNLDRISWVVLQGLPLSPSIALSPLFWLQRDLHWLYTCRKPCLILCLPRRLLDSRMVS